MKKLLFTQLFVLMALVGFSQATKTTLSLGFWETAPAQFVASAPARAAAVPGGGKLVITADTNYLYNVVSYNLNDGSALDSINVSATKKAYIGVWASATEPVTLRADLADKSGKATNAGAAAVTPALTTTSTYYNIGPITVFKQLYPSTDTGAVNASSITQIDFFLLPVDSAGKALYYTGTVTIDSVIISDSPIVTAVTNPNLVSNSTKLFPNPVSDVATLAYTLKEGSNVKLVLNDMAGRPIRTIAEGYRNAGEQSETVNVSDLQQGLYNVSFVIDGASVKIQKLSVK